MTCWFKPSPATDLGVCRVLTFAIFLCWRLNQDVTVWATVPDAFWMPIHLFRWFAIPVFPERVIGLFDLVCKVSLLTSMVGLCTRASTITSFVLGSYLIGLPQNFGQTQHSDAIVPLILLIFAVSRCGDGWSVDRLMPRVLQPHDPAILRRAPSGEYTWPIRLVWLLTSLAFCAAGVAKLRHAGLDWVMTDSMAHILLLVHYGPQGPPTRIGLFLASDPWLYQPLAAVTVILETLAPLAIFNRIARWVIIPGLCVMLLSFRFILGFTFAPFFSLFVFWVPWDRLGQRVFAPHSRAGSAVSPGHLR